MDWDPVSGIRGLAWPVTRKGGSVVDGRRAAAIRTVPTSTQTVTDVAIPVAHVIGSGVYQLDVYKESDLPSVLSTVTYRPNEDKLTSGWSGVGAGATMSARVNESVLDLTNYTYHAPSATAAVGAAPPGTFIGFGLGSAAGLGAGSQLITGVTVNVVCDVILPTTPSLIGLNVFGVLNDRPSDVQFVTPAMGVQSFSWTWMTNPATGEPWTEQDSIDFDDTALFNTHAGFGHYSPNGAGAAGDRGRLYYLDTVVSYFTDPRLATAPLTISTEGWKTFNTADFTKTNAQNLVTLVTRISGSGSLVIPSLDSGLTAPGSAGAYRPSFDALGNVADLNDLLTEAHPIIFPVAGAASVDSQPYVDLVRSPVSAGFTVSQEFTADATDSRRWVQVVAGSSRHQIPSADLTVKIKNGAGTQVGGTGTITRQSIADAPYPLAPLECVLASAAALTSGTQYHVELTCTAPDGEGWDVAILDAQSPPVSGYTAGFGSNTDRATVATVEYNDLDVAVVVGTVPAAVTGFTAT